MKNKVILFGLVLCVCAGIFLPGLFLHLKFNSLLNNPVKVSDSQNYSYESFLSRNASQYLSEYERMKLISGVWKSDTVLISNDDIETNTLEIVAMARDFLSLLFESGCYPYDLLADNAWYTWEVSAYKCTEESFHTYCAYFYKVTFSHYKTDEVHDVYISENGSFLGVRNNRPVPSISQLERNASALSAFCSALYKKSTPVYLFQNGSALVSTMEDLPVSGSFYSLGMVLNAENINTPPTDLTALKDNESLFKVYYGTNDYGFVFGIIPWE